MLPGLNVQSSCCGFCSRHKPLEACHEVGAFIRYWLDPEGACKEIHMPLRFESKVCITCVDGWVVSRFVTLMTGRHCSALMRLVLSTSCLRDESAVLCMHSHMALLQGLLPHVFNSDLMSLSLLRDIGEAVKPYTPLTFIKLRGSALAGVVSCCQLDYRAAERMLTCLYNACKFHPESCGGVEKVSKSTIQRECAIPDAVGLRCIGTAYPEAPESVQSAAVLQNEDYLVQAKVQHVLNQVLLRCVEKDVLKIVLRDGVHVCLVITCDGYGVKLFSGVSEPHQHNSAKMLLARCLA